ncbi:MAG: hypothetical protein QOJ58_4204, partial [Alphaproteobacteria bacterium]|nr:hypothetical protein [Alphaproteobacteria bacterium]
MGHAPKLLHLKDVLAYACLPSHFNSCSGARVPGLSRFRKTVGSLHRSTLPVIL